MCLHMVTPRLITRLQQWVPAPWTAVLPPAMDPTAGQHCLHVRCYCVTQLARNHFSGWPLRLPYCWGLCKTVVHLECVSADSPCFPHRKGVCTKNSDILVFLRHIKAKFVINFESQKTIMVTYTTGKRSACTLMKEDLYLKSLSWKLLITSHLNSAACSHVRSLFFLNQALLLRFSWFKPLWNHYQALKPRACCLSPTWAWLLLPGFAAQWPDVFVQPHTLQCCHTAAGAQLFLPTSDSSANPSLISHKWLSRLLMVEFGNKVQVIWFRTGN